MGRDKLYPGKRLEEDFFTSAKNQKIKIQRLYDTTNGFRGIANPCDFITTDGVHTLFIECKVTNNVRLPLSNISNNQYVELLDWDRTKGALGGILVFYKPDEILNAALYFIRLNALDEFCKENQSAASLPMSAAELIGLRVKYKPKRTHISIDVAGFLSDTARW